MFIFVYVFKRVVGNICQIFVNFFMFGKLNQHVNRVTLLKCELISLFKKKKEMEQLKNQNSPSGRAQKKIKFFVHFAAQISSEMSSRAVGLQHVTV